MLPLRQLRATSGVWDRHLPSSLFSPILSPTLIIINGDRSRPRVHGHIKHRTRKWWITSDPTESTSSVEFGAESFAADVMQSTCMPCFINSMMKHLLCDAPFMCGVDSGPRSVLNGCIITREITAFNTCLRICLSALAHGHHVGVDLFCYLRS